jgi:K+-sensing histidine kinase KdpD
VLSRLTRSADRLGQVVANYLTNTLKYSPPARPVAASVQPEGAVVRMQVRDQGPGLTDEQQRDIWEQYRRVPNVAVQDDTHAAIWPIARNLRTIAVLIDREAVQDGQ